MRLFVFANYKLLADYYKIDKFKKELAKKGFVDIEVVPMQNDVSNIKVQYENSELSVIKKICQEVEFYFKNSN